MLEVIKPFFFENKQQQIHLSGLITGMTQYTTKAHIIRAALEGIAYQTREVRIDIFFFPYGSSLDMI